MAHHCCDPCRATHCRAQSVAANSRYFRGVAGMSLYTPHSPSKRLCCTCLATPLSLCRRESSLQKRIALNGGVAATLTPVTLHCATTLKTLTSTLKTLTSLNKKVRPFFLSDNSIWRFRSVSSGRDHSISRSCRLFSLAIKAFGASVHCSQILYSLRKNGQEEPRLLNLRRLRSSR